VHTAVRTLSWVAVALAMLVTIPPSASVGDTPARGAARRTATHGHITVFAGGDSEMQILDDDLANALAAEHVSASSTAVPGSGLTNPSVFDWQRAARATARRLHPDVSVIFIGANDGFSTPGPHGTRENCCGAAWSAGYATLVRAMMRTLLQGTRSRVYWFLLPAPAGAGYATLFDAVNAGIRRAARAFPTRVGLIDADAYFTPGNRYRNAMDVDGLSFTIHEPDGVHLSSSADGYAAQLVLRRMRADHVIP